VKAFERRIELLHHCNQDVPAAVLVDIGRLRQVLVNLIGNAIKFTERGEVEVTSALLPAGPGDAPERRLLEFKVRDTGIGIAADQHAHLFKPFTQLDDSSTRRHGGTGLGLAISRNLVHSMGGTISLESEVGRGSLFTFTVAVSVLAAAAPVRDLAGLQIGLAMPPGSLRRELERLLVEWRAEAVVVDQRQELGGLKWEIGLVAVDDEVSRDCGALAGPAADLPPDKLVGLVPVAMAGELRVALRLHFRLLMNKPIHHGALYALLAGARTSTPTVAPALAPFGFHILVVEDNPMNQRLIQRVLTNLGCTHHVVENGRRAIDELSRCAADYDLVLLDLHMPELDGVGALQEIRRGQAGPVAQSIWVVALTADARPDERKRAMAAGLNDFLTKPLRMSELHTALRRFRDERGARQRVT